MVESLTVDSDVIMLMRGADWGSAFSFSPGEVGFGRAGSG